MKKQALTFLILILVFKACFGQFEQMIDKEVHLEKYTFEKAKEFEDKEEYQKAIWVYINLFPENTDSVVKCVKLIKNKLDTVDMSWYIKSSFALYGAFDPDTWTNIDGESRFVPSITSKKGSWGDQLIVKISDPTGPLSSASEYNFRSIDRANANNYEGALADLNKAIEIEPRDQFYFNRAYTKTILKDYAGAITDFDSAIELEYRLSEAYYERGFCKSQLEKVDSAIIDYTKAIEVNNKNLNAYNSRAVLYYHLKKLPEAIKDLDKVIELDPNSAEMYFNRGSIKKEIGDLDGTCEDWVKAYKLGLKRVRQLIREIDCIIE